jgi:hypothetical protein
VLLYPYAAWSQPQELEPKVAAALKVQDVKKRLDVLRRSDKEIGAIDEHLAGRGFKPLKGDKNFLGRKTSFESQGQKFTQTVYLQDYAKEGSSDAVAVGQVTVTAGERTEAYSFFLEAPGGKLEEAVEHRVDKRLNVTKVNSWWGCMRGKLGGCGSTCQSALSSCWGGSWTGYLGCLAVKCGGCYVKAAACCGCDCAWWCRWAVGCCDR